MEHVRRKVGIQVGQHTLTDTDYDVALFVDKEENFRTALLPTDEVSKFGFHVSCTKTKLQNLGLGPITFPITVLTQYKNSHT